MCSVVVIGEASGQRVPGFYSRQQHLYCRLAFECGGGQAGGPVQEEKARPGGPVQNISDVGGGEVQLSSLSAQELTHSSLYNIITHKR
jgi:hypothetical protein